MRPELKHRLSDLAQKLGISVEHLWQVMVRQAAYHGSYDLLQTAVLLAATVAVRPGMPSCGASPRCREK
jgi:hypothetical protein